jgi:small subunit ribosomal protein S1
MVSKETLRRYELDDASLEAELAKILGSGQQTDFDNLIAERTGDVPRDAIVPATILKVDMERMQVLVDIGGKAEAPIPLHEFEDEQPVVGQKIEVFYRGDDRSTNVPVVSKREADRERSWTKVVGVYEVGDVIEGEVKKMIKGGLLTAVDGVLVFMPASQIDIRRVANPTDYIGRTIRAKIVKIDEERKNIVVSRRQLLEEERAEKRDVLLRDLAEGQTRKGEVKNIADFGAFVDLGGIDGLLHVTDMSYGRIKHPREMLKIGDVIEVMVIGIDRDRNRVALSLKALSKDPWAEIAARFPIGTVHKGRIANIVSYGLFVELEIFVKAIDLEKKEMSLSVREVEGNPWDRIAEHYAPGTVIEATVKNLASYGAFVEIEEGIDGLLHNTDFHWTRKIQHPSEIVKKGDRIQCVVLAVDKEKQRISLGMKQLTKNPWEDYIPAHYHVGDLLNGSVTKHIPAGCFVKLEEDLEAFMHYSSLPHEWHDAPAEHCIPGLRLEVRVVRVDCGEERIGLNFVHAEFPENDAVRAEWAEAKAAKEARKAARAAAKAAKDAGKEGDEDGAPVAGETDGSAKESAPETAS